MILSISGVVLLGIIVFLFFRRTASRRPTPSSARCSASTSPAPRSPRASRQAARASPACWAGSSSDARPHPLRTPSGDSRGPATTPPHSEQRQRAIARSRELARTAADSATDVLHPLITITRGLRLLAAAGRRGGPRHPRNGVVPRCSWPRPASWSWRSCRTGRCWP